MDNLVTSYKQLLNLKDHTFSLIDHEDATVAIVYKVTRTLGTPLILKICPRNNDYLREVYFLRYFSKIVPVPQILQLVPPQPNLHGAILMECLAGSLLKATGLTETLAYEIGSHLARIHSNCTEGYGDLLYPTELSSDPRKYFNMKFEEGLAECSNHLPQALLEQCRLYYAQHVGLLDLVDGPCITHRDFRAGNIIVAENKVQGIIDWSSARASFAEEDFCFLEHDDLQINSGLKSSFLAGYASIRLVPDYHVIMPLLRLSRAIAIIGFAIKRGTWNTTLATQYQFNLQFIETLFKSF